MKGTIYWHDYETFGSDPRRDRASQFAGIRTDTDLNEVGEPLVMYCKPATDYLPHPEACLITGITPQVAQQHGVAEAEFIARIRQQFMQPGTCGAGYNSLRFDDEVTRQLLYRNFYDPYEREWRNGNSRWDIIDMLRLCSAVRPDGIQWPRRDDGRASFRLEDLSAANGIEHAAAHDALSDVRATIAIARLVKQQQPRLYDYVYELRSKHRVRELIDVQARKPLLHASALYSEQHGRVALAMPLIDHPEDNNGVLFYDLRVDPTPWLDLPEEALREALFKPAAERDEGEVRLPVNVVHVNRCPALVTPGVLNDEQYARFGVDLPTARRHWQALNQREDFIRRLQAAFVRQEERPPVTDPDYMLYAGGFFSAEDRPLMQRIQTLSASQLASEYSELTQQFSDPRGPELLFRYVARNHPESLSEQDKQRWVRHCYQRLMAPAEPGQHLGLETFEQAIMEAQARVSSERDHEILDALMGWGASLEEWLALASADDEQFA